MFGNINLFLWFDVKQVTTGPFAWFKVLESCLGFYDYTHLYRGTDSVDGDDVK